MPKQIPYRGCLRQSKPRARRWKDLCSSATPRWNQAQEALSFFFFFFFFKQNGTLKPIFLPT